MFALALALAYAALAWVGIQVSIGGGKIAAIWLPCAMAAAAGLNWRVPLARILLPCFIAHNALLLAMGRPPGSTFFFALANTVEIGIIVLLARRIVPTPAHVREPRPPASSSWAVCRSLGRARFRTDRGHHDREHASGVPDQLGSMVGSPM